MSGHAHPGGLRADPAPDREPRQPSGPRATPAAAASLSQSAGNAAVTELLRNHPGQPLPPALRRGMEQRFGADFGAVRIHDTPRAGDSVNALGAKAITQGDRIAFAPGRFAPDTADGKRLLAHELAHVVQQSRGGEAPVGAAVPPLEQDAREAAEAVAEGGAPAPAGASAVGAMADDAEKPRQAPIYNAGPTQSAGLPNNVAPGTLNTEINAITAGATAPDRREGPLTLNPALQLHVRDRTSPNWEQGFLASYGGVAPWRRSAITGVPGSSYQTGSLFYTNHYGTTTDPNSDAPQTSWGNWLNAGFLFGNPGAGNNWNPALSDTVALAHTWGDWEFDANAGVNAQALGSVNNRNVNAFLSPYLSANIARQFGRNQFNVEGLLGANLGLGGAADTTGADPRIADPGLPASLRYGAGIGFQRASGDTTWGVEAVVSGESAPNIPNRSQRRLPVGFGLNWTVSSF